MKDKKTRFIFVTGGVCSSLGKGVSVASLGLLLEAHGYKISIMKMDPYLNVDPGTMSPYQHGEVYVTEDGAETDLDLGYYERFTNAQLTRKNSVSTGQIYNTVIQRERRGDYLGKTVQVIPHITNEIKKRIYDVALEDPDLDFVLVEIGGTVGDIESVPFLESIRQVRLELGNKKVMNIHLTLVPSLTVAGEMKTKPTQHSVKELMKIGIHPDILLCRGNRMLDDDMRSKIALFCNVQEDHVFTAVDCSTIYDIPEMFYKQNFDKIVLDHFQMPINKKFNLSKWQGFVKSLHNPSKKVKIAVVGKYISLQDAYKSIYASLLHGAVANNAELEITRIDPEEIEKKGAANCKTVFKDIDGILVPGGFGSRGIEGKIMAITYARENNIPLFGICLGMQCAVIEFARNVIGWDDANSTEFDMESPHKVISLLEDQEIVEAKGGTMRLGGYKCDLVAGSKLKEIYKKDQIVERHRHRFEFTLKYKDEFEKHGLTFGGFHPGNALVEAIELKKHPWFVCVQYHPEFKSQPTNPHPLFKDFIKAAVQK